MFSGTSAARLGCERLTLNFCTEKTPQTLPKSSPNPSQIYPKSHPKSHLFLCILETIFEQIWPSKSDFDIFLQPVCNQNRSHQRNLVFLLFRKCILASTGAKLLSDVLSQLKEQRFKIASEMRGESLSLLIPIVAPKIIILAPFRQPFLAPFWQSF
jgi:hypothetical protein